MAEIPASALDILAEVACSALRKEILPLESSNPSFMLVDEPEKKVSSRSQVGYTKKLRTSFMKNLICKYTHQTSDELNRKFTYQCTYRPLKCHAFFSSFGSEKKALDEIEHHLRLHLKQKSPGKDLKIPLDESPSSKSERSDSNLGKSLNKAYKQPLDAKERLRLFQTIQNDHDYYSSSMKQKKGIDSSSSFMPNPKPQNRMRCESSIRNGILPQFVIKTCPFPYIHDPVNFNLAQVEEIDANGMLVDQREPPEQPLGIYPSCSENLKNAKNKKEEFLGSSKIQDVTGSVLECMENQSKPTSSRRMPNRARVFEDSAENSENLKKIDEELAMKLVEELRSRKKKRKGEPLVCKICRDKQFTARGTLICHYYSHAAMKPHSCDVCGSKFTRRFSLKYHMLIHENRCRFFCSSCGRGFRHPNHFKKHVHNHTGPFDCGYCGSPFKTENTFKRHLKTKHGKVLTDKGIEDLVSNLE